MRKLLRKKVNLFGKSIPIFVIALFGIALVSAALVGYLSLPITGKVIVNSPLSMKFEGGDYDATAIKDLGIIHGGETFTYKTWTKNEGFNDVESYPITTIISANNWTGQEFTSVKFEDVNGPWPILDLLYVVNDNGNLQLFKDGNWDVADKKVLKLFFDNDGDGTAQKYAHATGESWNEITITTNLVIAPDTYTIKLCHLNDLTESCVLP